VSFRRTLNRHDLWRELLAEHVGLLDALPRGARETEAAFRDYVTSGTHRGVAFSPSVDELSVEAFEALSRFINHEAQFDMDASLFDSFNARRLRSRP
jgi:hypothetical protein